MPEPATLAALALYGFSMFALGRISGREVVPWLVDRIARR